MVSYMVVLCCIMWYRIGTLRMFLPAATEENKSFHFDLASASAKSPGMLFSVYVQAAVLHIWHMFKGFHPEYKDNQGYIK